MKQALVFLSGVTVGFLGFCFGARKHLTPEAEEIYSRGYQEGWADAEEDMYDETENRENKAKA